MSSWGSCKARELYRALTKIGWSQKREARGSHRVMTRVGFPDFVFAFHDGDEIGPRMLARVARHTGMKPEDL